MEEAQILSFMVKKSTNVVSVDSVKKEKFDPPIG
jgi:hypothetical protein